MSSVDRMEGIQYKMNMMAGFQNIVVPFLRY